VSDSVRPHRRQPTRLHRPWDSPGKNTGVGCHFLLQCMKEKSESEVSQSCPTLRDPMDCSLPGSSVHGIFQARVLEWGAIKPSTFYLKFKWAPCILSAFFFLESIIILILYLLSYFSSQIFYLLSFCPIIWKISLTSNPFIEFIFAIMLKFPRDHYLFFAL